MLTDASKQALSGLLRSVRWSDCAVSHVSSPCSHVACQHVDRLSWKHWWGPDPDPPNIMESDGFHSKLHNHNVSTETLG